MNIAIRLPRDYKEIFSCLHFLHALAQKHNLSKDSLYLLAPKELQDFSSIFPFKAYYVEIKEEKVSSLMNTFRFSRLTNLRLLNFQVYYNLSSRLEDAALGFFLGIKERVSFDNFKGKLFYTKKIHWLKGRTFLENNLALVAKENDLKNIGSRYQDFDSDPLDQITLVDAALLDEFEDQEILKSFNFERLELNKMDFLEKTKTLLGSCEIITSNAFDAHLASYLGCKVSYIGNEKMESAEHFIGILNAYTSLFSYIDHKG